MQQRYVRFVQALSNQVEIRGDRSDRRISDGRKQGAGRFSYLCGCVASRGVEMPSPSPLPAHCSNELARLGARLGEQLSHADMWCPSLVRCGRGKY